MSLFEYQKYCTDFEVRVKSEWQEPVFLASPRINQEEGRQGVCLRYELSRYTEGGRAGESLSQGRKGKKCQQFVYCLLLKGHAAHPLLPEFDEIVVRVPDFTNLRK